VEDENSYKNNVQGTSNPSHSRLQKTFHLRNFEQAGLSFIVPAEEGGLKEGWWRAGEEGSDSISGPFIPDGWAGGDYSSPQGLLGSGITLETKPVFLTRAHTHTHTHTHTVPRLVCWMKAPTPGYSPTLLPCYTQGYNIIHKIISA
jgi:hypothetical protein